MSREGAARRNRALRKIGKAQHIDPEIKLAIETILDLLSRHTDYTVAWPTAETIARRQKRSRRTGQWYVKAIKALGIFRIRQMPVDATKEYFQTNFGFVPNFNKCGYYAPNIYEADLQHPLWDKSTALPKEVDKEMGAKIRDVKSARNRTTTSRLASDPRNRPAECLTAPAHRYDIAEIRKSLRKSLLQSRNEMTDDDILGP